MNRLIYHRVFTLLLVFMLVFTIVGCSGSLNTNQAGNQSPRQPNSVEYPLKLKDQAGQVVTIKQEPKRIVSLIPSAAEIIYALKLENRLVAVTTNDNYPAEVKQLPKVGDMKINPEKVLEQAPDLVLASSLIGKESLEQLKKRGVTVLIVDANTIRQIYQSIDLIAQATNQSRTSDQLIAQLEKRKLAIFRKVGSIPPEKRMKVWLEMGPELFTVGNNTLQHELIRLAGGKNVAEKEKGWPQISVEKVISWNPQLIISAYGGTEQILKRSGWNSVDAIKNKRVHAINPDLLSRPGPRVIDGLEQLAKLFYPEQFGVAK